MTITMATLGSNGRLGNQMFQYAGLRGLAARHGYNWQIPRPESYGSSNYGLFECFKMGSVTEENFLNGAPRRSITSGCFHFNEDFYNNIPNGIDITDYFQTEKYFSNISDIIRQDFEFKDEILETCKEVVDQFENPIFMHVRRGDYLNCSDFHPFVGMDYYEKALNRYHDVTVLLFSDDMEWCKQQELFNRDQFLHSEFDTHYNQLCNTNAGPEKSLIPYYDLCMMSLCKGGVIANSTMSWWAAWLIKSPSLPIIAPTPWFGPRSNNNVKDLLPTTWTQIER